MGLDIDLYTPKIDIGDDSADDIIIEITGLKSISKFIGLEDTPLYYDNGKFFKVENNKVVYTDIEWKDISGDIQEVPEIVAVISDLVNEVASDILDEHINLHNLNEEAHPYIQDIVKQNYNTLNTKIDNTKEELSEALNTEITNRETADNELSESIQQEALARIEADTNLQNNVDTLTNNLNTEIENRTNADNLLRDDIDSISGELAQEIISRQTQDNLLQEQITSNYNTLDDKIDTEISDRISTDTILQNNINELTQTVEDNNTAVNNRIDETNDTVSDLSNTVTSNYNTLDNKINTEISNRTSADTTLQNNIDTEASTRQNADTVLQNNINILSQTVTDNNTAINNKVDGINTALTNSINSLSNTVSNNYTTLDTKIDNTKNALDSEISDLSDTVSNNYTTLNTKIDNTKISLEGNISDLSDTVSQNYTDLSNAITSSADTINSRIDSEVSTLNTAIGTETTNRQNADNNLQSQIDAIVSSSDVFDIVGTYTELQAYDIATVPVNDIIKVLVDSTHNNTATYYRCVETGGVKSWSYIGAEGAYYTKSESDNRFVAKTIMVNGQPLSSNITLTASDVGALPNTTTIPTKTSDLTNDSGFITNAVNNLTNYYLKSETYTKAEVQQLIASIPQFSVVVVQTLPVTGERMVLYLVPKQGEAPDVYNEYIWVEDENEFELLGSTAVDLTGYAKESWVLNQGYITLSALNGYATETYVDTGLATKQNTLVSGTNIKTINNETVLGSGNINIQSSMVAYGTSNTAADVAEKEVLIPEITELNVGQILYIKPSASATVANLTIKLNNFTAYPIRYNDGAITTSTDDLVWNQNFVSQFIFDGTYWQFAGRGYDNNTTYTQNVLFDRGSFASGSGTYAITRYSLCLQKPDMTWEKVTNTEEDYSLATNKTVNTHGFLLNGEMLYYSNSTVLTNGAVSPANTMYRQNSGFDIRYSMNTTGTGYTAGDNIYLVGTIGVDGLFYLDSTQWWTNTLPNTNDGKIYVKIGKYVSGVTITLELEHPAYYHNGTRICLYQSASNKQDTLVSGTNIKTINNQSLLGSGNITIQGGGGSTPTNMVTTNTAQDISGRKTFLGEKAIFFKQQVTWNKLGFTLSSPSDVELAAFEYRPSTIGANALLNLNTSYSNECYVGFRYWGTPAVNIVAPKVATAGNYFIPTHITDGNTTVTASNTGTVNISTLLPDVSNFVTNTSLATTLQDYVLSSDLSTTLTNYVTSSSLTTVLNDYQPLLVSGTNIKTINNQSLLGSGNITIQGGGGGGTVDQTYSPTSTNAQSGVAINGAGFLTSSSLNGYATQSWVTSQGYTTNTGTVTSVNNVQPVNGNVNISIPSAVTESTVSGWGFTKNVGTVTSVNNVQPVNGNVTISIPDVSNFVTNSSLATTLADYQLLLVSGTNIKTINNNSILGSGNLTLDSLPSQTGQSGKFLTTDGTEASWANTTKITIRDWSVS